MRTVVVIGLAGRVLEDVDGAGEILVAGVGHGDLAVDVQARDGLRRSDQRSHAVL